MTGISKTDEADPNWLLQTVDGSKWAKEFMRINGNSLNEIDESSIHTWLACALMTGNDHKHWEWEAKVKKLKNVTDIQCSDGNWNFDHYMRGMANGLILAMAIMQDEEPKYLSAPEEPKEEILGELNLSPNIMENSYESQSKHL